jgi:hypothetical protein
MLFSFSFPVLCSFLFYIHLSPHFFFFLFILIDSFVISFYLIPVVSFCFSFLLNFIFFTSPISLFYTLVPAPNTMIKLFFVIEQINHRCLSYPICTSTYITILNILSSFVTVTIICYNFHFYLSHLYR